MTSKYYYKGNALSNIISGTKPGFEYTIYATTPSSFVSNYYLAGTDKITSYNPVSNLDKPSTTLGFSEQGTDLQNKTAVFTYAYAAPLKTNANSNGTTGSNTGQYASIQQFGGGSNYNIPIPSYINKVSILLWGGGGGGGAGGNNGASGGGGGGSGGWVFYPDYQVRTNSTNSIELRAGEGGAGGRNTGQTISGTYGGQSYFIDNTNGGYIAATGGQGALNGNGDGNSVAGGQGGWYDFVKIPAGGYYGGGSTGGSSGSGQAGYGGHGGQYPFSNDFNNTISSVNQAGTFFNSVQAQYVNGGTAGINAPGYGLGGGGGGGNGGGGTAPLYGGAGGAGYAQVWLYF